MKDTIFKSNNTNLVRLHLKKQFLKTFAAKAFTTYLISTYVACTQTPTQTANCKPKLKGQSGH
jgi:hypothetical protein